MKLRQQQANEYQTLYRERLYSKPLAGTSKRGAPHIPIEPPKKARPEPIITEADLAEKRLEKIDIYRYNKVIPEGLNKNQRILYEDWNKKQTDVMRKLTLGLDVSALADSLDKAEGAKGSQSSGEHIDTLVANIVEYASSVLARKGLKIIPTLGLRLKDILYELYAPIQLEELNKNITLVYSLMESHLHLLTEPRDVSRNAGIDAIEKENEVSRKITLFAESLKKVFSREFVQSRVINNNNSHNTNSFNSAPVSDEKQNDSSLFSPLPPPSSNLRLDVLGSPLDQNLSLDEIQAWVSDSAPRSVPRSARSVRNDGVSDDDFPPFRRISLSPLPQPQEDEGERKIAPPPRAVEVPPEVVVPRAENHLGRDIASFLRERFASTFREGPLFSRTGKGDFDLVIINKLTFDQMKALWVKYTRTPSPENAFTKRILAPLLLEVLQRQVGRGLLKDAKYFKLQVKGSGLPKIPTKKLGANWRGNGSIRGLTGVRPELRVVRGAKMAKSDAPLLE
jgi:hypothetical protein